MFRGFSIISSRFACITTHQNGGSYILATDASSDSILSVWQWQWGHLLGKVAVSTCLSLTFLNFHLDLLQREMEI